MKPAGKRLAPETGHRVDTAKEATGLPLCIGGKERVAECVERRTMATLLTYLVPMPRFLSGGVTGGQTVLFSLPTFSEKIRGVC